MITEIKFKFGKGPGANPEKTKLTPVTVFVGPNNSGKSRILAEIRRFVSAEEQSPLDYVLLDRLEFGSRPPQAIEETARRFSLPIPPGQPMQPGEVLTAHRA